MITPIKICMPAMVVLIKVATLMYSTEHLYMVCSSKHSLLLAMVLFYKSIYIHNYNGLYPQWSSNASHS